MNHNHTYTHTQTHRYTHTMQSMQNKMENKIKKSYEDINYKKESTHHCTFIYACIHDLNCLFLALHGQTFGEQQQLKKRSREIRFHPSVEEDSSLDSSKSKLSVTLRKTHSKIRFSMYISVKNTWIWWRIY